MSVTLAILWLLTGINLGLTWANRRRAARQHDTAMSWLRNHRARLDGSDSRLNKLDPPF